MSDTSISPTPPQAPPPAVPVVVQAANSPDYYKWIPPIIIAWVPATILGFLWINSSISKHETLLNHHTQAHEQFVTLDKDISTLQTNLTKIESGFVNHADQIKKLNDEQVNSENVTNIINRDREDIHTLQTELKQAYQQIQALVTQANNFAVQINSQVTNHSTLSAELKADQLIGQTQTATMLDHTHEIEKLRNEAAGVCSALGTMKERLAALEATAKAK